jgi:hypothetical protein
VDAKLRVPADAAAQKPERFTDNARESRFEAAMNVREYLGSGSVHYVDNQVDCAFTLTQSSDGDVRLECTTVHGASPPAQWITGWFGPMPVPDEEQPMPGADEQSELMFSYVPLAEF